MLFDPRPKTSREDLFDREDILKELHSSIDQPMIVLTGIRRVGKTSIINVFLNEIDIPSIIIDLRELRENYGYRDLYSVLSRAFSSKITLFREMLQRVRGVRIAGFEVEFSWRGRDTVSLFDLFDRLNERRAVIAFDEAQMLRGPRSRLVLNALAHAYDYDRNLTFVLTGSEVGLLSNFLGLDDEDSPLYGRHVKIVEVRRFTREESLEFLRKGFRELGMNVPEDLLERAVEAFDGIPGWLTYFGRTYYESRGKIDLDLIEEKAIKLATSELRKIVRSRGRRYAHVLRAIALGADSWSKVKDYVEGIEGSTVSKSSISNIVKTLEDMSIVKSFKFLDPVYRKASTKL